MIELLVYPLAAAAGLLALGWLSVYVLTPFVERVGIWWFLATFGAAWGLVWAILEMALR